MAKRRFARPLTRKRMTDWVFGAAVPTGLVSIASGAQAIIGSVVSGEGSIPPGTIVRIRGSVHIELAAETANSTLICYGVACGLFDDRAVAVSPGAGVGLPEPLGDADDEKWMWIKYGYLGDGPAITSTAPESDGTARRLSVDIEVDCKAKRKWDENQQLVWLVQNAPVDGTATELDACVMARMLLMPA